MQRKILLPVLLCFFLFLSACAGGTQQQADPPEAAAATEEQADTGDNATEEQTDTDDNATETVAEPTADTSTEPTAASETDDPAEPTVSAAGVLQRVLDRGNLICGVNGGLPGFSNIESDGSYTGFDVDFCRAVAAAIFDDPEAVEFIPLNAQERFTAVQTGAVDVLFRNTTVTVSRDSSLGLDFGPVVFHDGQGIMVNRALNITTIEELDGATICVQGGTTTELNLTDQFRARGINYTPVVLEDIDTNYQTYDQGGCDAVTSDRSQLISRRTTLTNPDDHVILEGAISSEPLAPAVVQGDSQWRDIVTWVVYTTFLAESWDIDSTNLETAMESENPEIRRLLGVEGELGSDLGLPNDFVVSVVGSVGNYAEIYNRNLGPDTPLNLDRGPNQTPEDGGLLFAPPFR
ncbi:MAG: amino acid ABC transporter substrate-binding protein [Chloroflexaceae bacterium]|nr:amino acid ABC transporter substrate-binding protein [Chloroflexaceae bacterium]